MDEWMLNDLLECSVCLERLDTSSKVLPCQHTFCKKCLEEIVTTHKELRCPECRVLVDIKIDDLPPNVLLMRILEGMRNAAPKKRNSGSGVAPPAGNRHHMSPPQHHYQHQQQHYHPPQQPPPSLQPQHHLPTSVSSSGSSTLPLTNPNPILQIPRFCYTPNQHILLPRLGKSDCNHFPTVLATGHAVPATITLNHPTVGHQVPASNPTILTPTGHAVPNPNLSATCHPISALNPASNPNPPTIYNPNSSAASHPPIPAVATSNSSTKNDLQPRSTTSSNFQHQLFYSFPQARLISSAGGVTSTQIVQHCQINTTASSAGLTPRYNASVVSTHTSNGLSNGASTTQTCPHSYPGFGSISTVGVVPPRNQQHNSFISAPSPVVTSSALLTTISNGQQRLSHNSLLAQSTSKPSSTTTIQATTNTSQNYLLLSNAMSSSSQGPSNPQICYAEASGGSTNQVQCASSKVTPVFSLANVGNRSQSQVSSDARSTSTNQSSTNQSIQSSTNQSRESTSIVTSTRNVTTVGNVTTSNNLPNVSMATPSVSNNNQVSSGTSLSTIAASQSTKDTKDAAVRSRPNSVYQYSQLADCLSVLPTTKSSPPDNNTDPPLPPVRSESIAQTDSDANAQQQSSVGNSAVIGAKTIGNTDSSVTALPSTAANQSVTLIKGINQPCARAVYDYLSKMPGDLSFKEGDLIILRRKIDNNWYHGECRGQSGVFPLSYVQILTPLPNHIPQCKALFDFRMNNDDEEGCLTFNKGDVVTVIRRVDENWAEGRLGERIGIFPLAFVELNNVARALMKLSINSQPGPSRLAPPTPTVDSSSGDATPLISTDHTPPVTTTGGSSTNTATTTNTNHHTAAAAIASDGSTSTTLTSPSSSSTSSTSSSSSSTTPPTSSSASSPSSPPPPSHSQSAKRHSFNALQNQQSQHNQQHSLQPADQPNNRHSAEILTTNEQSSASHGPHSLAVMTSGSNSSCNTPVHSAGDSSLLTRSSSQRRHHQRSASADAHPSPPPQHVSLLLPATYVALYPYKPQKSDELELKRGNVYTVTERCQDGWFKGTNKHQKCGVFPGNYVAPSKSLPAVQAQLRGIGRIAGGAGGRVSGVAATAAPSPEPRTYFRSAAQNNNSRQLLTAPGPGGNVVGSNPPELPPRSVSPATISSSWHSGGQPTSTPTRAAHNMSASVGSSHHDNSTSVGRNSPITVTTSPPNVTVTSSKSSEKVKKERTSGGGIMRIFSMKKSPPPPTSYSMDNPVFEDGGTTANATAATTTNQPTTTANLTTQSTHAHQHVHVRSGSCPSQLLQVTPPSSGDQRSSPSHHHHHQHHHRLFSPTSSQRLKHKERPSLNGALRPSGGESTPAHRKSNSLDAGAGGKQQQLVPVVRERFRCIVPYPPNSEYELELQVGDLIYVHRKRDDGWYKGTQQRTGKTGLFPASFVQSF